MHICSESKNKCKHKIIQVKVKHYTPLKLLQCCSSFTSQTFHPRVSNCTVHNNEIWIKEFITGLKRSTACVELPLSPAQEMKIISSIWNAETDLMWPSSQLRHRKLSTKLNPFFDSSPRSEGKFLNIWLKLLVAAGWRVGRGRSLSPSELHLCSSTQARVRRCREKILDSIPGFCRRPKKIMTTPDWLKLECHHWYSESLQTVYYVTIRCSRTRILLNIIRISGVSQINSHINCRSLRTKFNNQYAIIGKASFFSEEVSATMCSWVRSLRPPTPPRGSCQHIWKAKSILLQCFCPINVDNCCLHTNIAGCYK